MKGGAVLGEDNLSIKGGVIAAGCESHSLTLPNQIHHQCSKTVNKGGVLLQK